MLLHVIMPYANNYANQAYAMKALKKLNSDNKYEIFQKSTLVKESLTSLHFLILFQVALSKAKPMLCSCERQVDNSA